VNADTTTALITSASTLGAAVVAAVPAAMALMRRHRGAVQADGAATREALTAMGERLDARINDVRDDIDGVREDVARVREWQAGHDAEHLLIGRQNQRGDT
jgi:hypothetical protein